jgi:DNA-3-methyladenine glycosylase II
MINISGMIYLITRGEKITYSLNSPEIKTLYTSDARLATLIFWYGDLSYSLCADEFTFLVETIIGQMLSNKAANAIITRLYSLCNGILTPEKLLILGRSNLKAIGLSRQKVEYIFDFAEMLSNQPDFFVGLDKATDNEVIEVLISLHGIGNLVYKNVLDFCFEQTECSPL